MATKLPPNITGLLVFTLSIVALFTVMGWRYTTIDAQHGIYHINIKNKGPFTVTVTQAHGQIHAPDGTLLAQAELEGDYFKINPREVRTVQFNVYHLIEWQDLEAYQPDDLFTLTAELRWKLGQVPRDQSISVQITKAQLVEVVETVLQEAG